MLNTLPRNGDCVFQWRGERINDCNTLAFQNAVKAAKAGKRAQRIDFYGGERGTRTLDLGIMRAVSKKTI